MSDDEIDEDGAFNSEDEKRYGSLLSSIMERSGDGGDDDESDNDNDGADASASDDEDEEEGGGMLLSDMLNGAAESGAVAAAEEKKRRKLLGMLSLEPKKRRAYQEITERTEGVAEGEHSLGGASASGGGGGNLRLADLMAGDSTSAADAALRHQLGKIQKKDTLAEPLAPIVQRRIERRLHYKGAKKQAGKWVPFVQANRQAKHLSFVSLNMAPKEKLSTASMASKFRPTRKIEKEVAGLLKASGLDSESAMKAREEKDLLSVKDVSAEELVARREELQKMRALMFYSDQKSKRVKKIKSKLYHRIRKKKRERDAKAQEEELWKSNPELAKQMQEREETKRARLRMTLKHRNTTKWMKKTLKRGGGAGGDAKNAVQHELREREALHRKIMMKKKKGPGDDENATDSSEDEEGGELDESQLRAKAATLLHEIDADSAEGAKKKPKGLFGLKFMQRSLEQQREAARIRAQALVDEMDARSDGTFVAGATRAAAREAASESGERRRFGGCTESARVGAPVTSAEEKARVAAVRRAMPGASLQVLAAQTQAGRTTSLATASAISVPLSGSAAGPFDIPDFEAAAGEEPTAASAAPKLDVVVPKPAAPAAQRTKETRRVVAAEKAGGTSSSSSSNNNNNNDNNNKNDKNPWLVPERQSKSRRRSGKAGGGTGGEDEAAVLDVAAATAELEVQKEQQRKKKRKIAGASGQAGSTEEETQRKLVQQAFAGAGAEAEAEFKARKEELVDASVAKEEKVPKVAGWGSWTGMGVTVSAKSLKRKKRKEELKTRIRDAKKQKAAAKRKDSHLKHVIISEKRNKKAAAFAVKSVPYPFTSRAQYEQTIKRSMGRECNTARHVDRATMPEVFTRSGVIIVPASLPKQPNKHKG